MISSRFNLFLFSLKKLKELFTFIKFPPAPVSLVIHVDHPFNLTASHNPITWIINVPLKATRLCCIRRSPRSWIIKFYDDSRCEWFEMERFQNWLKRDFRCSFMTSNLMSNLTLVWIVMGADSYENGWTSFARKDIKPKHKNHFFITSYFVFISENQTKLFFSCSSVSVESFLSFFLFQVIGDEKNLFASLCVLNV